MPIRRLMSLCSIVVALCCGVLCRVFYVGGNGNYAANAVSQTVQTVTVPGRRGDFLDRNGKLLTGVLPTWYALCLPGNDGYDALFPYAVQSAQKQLYTYRNSSQPFLVEIRKDLTGQGILCCESRRHFLGTPIAVHLLGSLNSEGHGVSGLEKAWDSVLYPAKAGGQILCTTTAQGRLLAGSSPDRYSAEQNKALVTLTLDAEIQRGCEAIALNEMHSGCIVVMECGSGDIVADVSVPIFDPLHVEKSIEADDGSLIDRSLCAYSVGSVFKPIVAATAYRYGYGDFAYCCRGSVAVGDKVYRCAQGKSHGEMDMEQALAQSCNCYFAMLGQELGGAAILNTSRRFGFGAQTPLAPGMEGAAGTLPEEQLLQSSGQLALLSFGQGKLTATPLQITAAMNALAGDGSYRPPSLVKVVCNAAGAQTVYGKEASTSAVPGWLAVVLHKMLVTVVEDGIGQEACAPGETAGGKTGTAQTGQFDAKGSELLNHWFSGFWPAQAPRYVVTVLQDGQTNPKTDSAKLFALVTQLLAAQTG